MRERPDLQLDIVASEVDEQVAPFLRETLDDIVRTAQQARLAVTEHQEIHRHADSPAGPGPNETPSKEIGSESCGR